MATKQIKKSDHSVQSPKTAERIAYILKCKTEGMSLYEIARELDLSVQYVKKLYDQSLDRVVSDAVDRHRKLENMKLDKLEREAIELRDTTSPLVSNGKIIRDFIYSTQGEAILGDNGKPLLKALEDLTPRFKSVEMRISIAKRRAALNGLDMPTKLAMTDPSGEKEAQVVQFYLPDNDRNRGNE